MNKLLMTVAETAAYLGISETQLRSIIRHPEAKFPVIQVSPHRMMVSLPQVKKWLDDQTSGGKQ